MPTSDESLPRPGGAQRVVLSVAERQALSKQKYLARSQRLLGWLEKPFIAVLTTRILGGHDTRYATRQPQEVFCLCRQMMRDLDMTYWGFTWELLLLWRASWEQRLEASSQNARERAQRCWTELTKTLLLMDILPYSEHIGKFRHAEPAILWLGTEQATAIQEAFLSMGQQIGYRGPRLRDLANIVLRAMALARKRSLAELTLADVRALQAQATHLSEMARDCAIPISRVMAAMGHWPAESITPSQLCGHGWFDWGATPTQMVRTFQRFLNDITPIYRPNTWDRYRIALRRFGDWLAQHDPNIMSVSQVRREHIEAYKQALAQMRCGDYTSPLHGNRTQNRYQPLSQATKRNLLCNLRSFFQQLEVLDYPERPTHKLWGPDDLPRMDEPLPRFIPDEDWHRVLEAIQQVDALQIRNGRYPLNYLRAVTALLVECGLRGSELCRLDTSCVMVATGLGPSEETYWLRVPIGKLHTDRVIPISRTVMSAIDAWMVERGPQPAWRDERTGKMVDFLFTYRGGPMRLRTLNDIIADICQQAGLPHCYTSHQFRHTVATKWRNNGMPLDTISKLLGHKDLAMTLRYSAVMPPTMRQEFEEAFASIAEEYRAVAKVRVVLSPEAYLEAQQQWREACWVDLGIGWCGLTVYLPCDNRLRCQRCPNFIPDKARLPLLEEQRQHLIALSAIEVLPASRQAEMKQAVATVEGNIRIAHGGEAMEQGETRGEMKTRVGGPNGTARTPVVSGQE